MLHDVIVKKDWSGRRVHSVPGPMVSLLSIHRSEEERCALSVFTVCFSAERIQPTSPRTTTDQTTFKDKQEQSRWVDCWLFWGHSSRCLLIAKKSAMLQWKLATFLLTENAVKDFTSHFSRLYKSAERSEILSPNVSYFRLMMSRARRFLGAQSLQNAFTNSPSLAGFEVNAIASRKSLMLRNWGYSSAALNMWINATWNCSSPSFYYYTKSIACKAGSHSTILKTFYLSFYGYVWIFCGNDKLVM